MRENGDVFLTRYHDEENNGFPGYWNHAAIYYEGFIIESLMEIGVHKIPFDEWDKGVDKYIQLRTVYDSPYADKAGKHSLTMIGLPYRMVTSVFRFLWLSRIKEGLNCVTLVRLAWKKALGKDPRWLKPDDIARDKMFYVVDTKIIPG